MRDGARLRTDSPGRPLRASDALVTGVRAATERTRGTVTEYREEPGFLLVSVRLLPLTPMRGRSHFLVPVRRRKSASPRRAPFRYEIEQRVL